MHVGVQALAWEKEGRPAGLVQPDHWAYAGTVSGLAAVVLKNGPASWAKFGLELSQCKG